MSNAFPASKKLSPNQILGQRGELQVADRVLAMNLSFHALNRLETGIDGMIELRDPVSHVTLAKWVGVQVKATESQRYTAETDAGFEYLLNPSDLSYWRGSNIPVIIVLLRLEDQTMFWKAVDCGSDSEPRRLVFDKTADRFDRSNADAVAALTVDKNQPGSYVPPMLAGDPLHLNLVRLILPPVMYVAQSPFKSQREATKEMLSYKGQHFFDWVIRDRTFWSFRDPRDTLIANVIDTDTLEEIETETLSQAEDVADENAFIDLLRRSVEAQLRDDLAFDKESRSLYFRAHAPGRVRKYEYRSLHQLTSADVVNIYEKEGRTMVMRHHAFSPRYQRIGDDWYISISPTFIFTADGFQPHPASSILLAGKKKLDRNGSVRGQIILWRYLLIASGELPSGLFQDQSLLDRRARIKFEALDPVIMPMSVPEDVWRRDDPNISNIISPETLL
jgi:hypothetical protein